MNKQEKLVQHNQLSEAIRRGQMTVAEADEISNTNTFDDYGDEQEINVSAGSNEEVLLAGMLQNAGFTIADDDLTPPGQSVTLYKLQDKGQDPKLVIKFHKETKNGGRFQIQVEHTYRDMVLKELNLLREQYRNLSDEFKGDQFYGLQHFIPIWVHWQLILNFDVHPETDKQAYEQALWDNFPHCWIDDYTAPKRRRK